VSPNADIKKSTRDIPKVLAMCSFAAALFLWSLVVWVIASQNNSNNFSNAFVESFLNFKEHFGVSFLTAAVFFLAIVGFYCLGVSRRESKLFRAKQKYEQTLRTNDYDELTGMFNRNAFERKSIETIEKISDDSVSHALLFMDLDRIKIVNDTAGRAAGDALLSQLSYVLQNKLRGTDIIARLCGDEFGVLLRNCDQNEATELAHVLIEAVDSFRLNWDDKLLSVGATIGFVMITNNNISFPNLLGRASSACYSAKRSNRGNVVKYSQAHASSYQDMRVSMQIKRAIDQNQFVLYHQRIMGIQENDSEWKSSEILIRMKGETETKVLTPGIFLPIAERYNMMRAIDRWVINSLFRYINEQQDSLLRNKHRFYINLSGDSLNDENFCDFLTDKINEFDINTKLLCFEITETIAIQNLQSAAYLIGFLKRLGCSFALDDFGTGTSSFAYLKYLPIDYLKIDGVFIKDIANDPIDYEIVKAIKKICNAMKIKVIAELVEDEKTINFLKLLDIDFVQGYAIQKPIPLE